MQDLSRITATEAVKLIRDGHIEPMEAVSYTHLTLPTILRV